MERETKTLLTSNNHTVVIKTYLTGKESNEIKSELFKGVTASGEPGEKPKIPMSLILPYERKQLETLIVSFDGNTENAIDALENLPENEYADIVATIKKESGLSLTPAK